MSAYVTAGLQPGPHASLPPSIAFTHLILIIYSSMTQQTRGAATCKPQGALQLDQPYPVPKVPQGGLPFCPNFPCTCCNRSHTLALRRTLYGALEEPLSFSAGCAAMMTVMACRVCDPEVGIGIKPAVCRATCDKWLEACRNEYFGFESVSGQLVPCTAAVASRLLVCSRLADLAPEGGEQLCRLAELEVSDGQPCYSGSESEDSIEAACRNAPKARPPRASRRAPTPAKKPRSAVNQWIEGAILGAACMAVMLGALWAGAWLRRWRLEDEPPPPPLPDDWAGLRGERQWGDGREESAGEGRGGGVGDRATSAWEPHAFRGQGNTTGGPGAERLAGQLYRRGAHQPRE